MRPSVLKEKGNTTPQHKKTSLPIEPWAGILLDTEQWLISSKVCAAVGTIIKDMTAPPAYKDRFRFILTCDFALYD